MDLISTNLYDLPTEALAGYFFHNRTANWMESNRVVDVISGFVSSGALSMWNSFWDSGESEEELRRAAIEQQEREFHSFVRQQIICLLWMIVLYLISYWIVAKFKSTSDNDALYSGDEDYFVYRISVWICSFSFAVSVGAIALLPFSVLGAELIQRYPDNYYLQWLSWSLINSLWNYVFILSNLSLFVLLPFSYFFIESQGFTKNKNGIMQRVYETLAVCALLIVVILCLADVVLSLMSSSVSLLTITSVNLPLIYSCVSLCGVALLLVSTPIGFAKMFSLVSEMAMAPVPSVDDHTMEVLERKYQERRAQRSGGQTGGSPEKSRSRNLVGSDDTSYRLIHRVNGSPVLGAGDISSLSISSASLPDSCSDPAMEVAGGDHPPSTPWRFLRGVSPSGQSSPKKFWVPLREKSLRWYQHVMYTVKYPFLIVCLLALTGTSLLMVVINSLKLMFGYRGLPVYAQYIEVQARHTFGLFGVVIEIVIILYVMATSLLGVYSMPFVRSMRPQRRNTSMTAIIINCSLVLVLSSALPVLANTLGITTFNLLGAYSSLEWLSNFRLVLAYNVLFAAVTMLCLVTQITSPVRKQIMRRLNDLYSVRPELLVPSQKVE